MGTWGASPSAFVSFVLRAVPSSSHVWGGTWEGGSCEERNADFAGETRISLERGLGAGGLGGYSTSSYVLGTLALEVALCQSASFHSTIGGKRWGEAMQGRGVRGRDDLLSQQTLSELQETKPQFETKIFIKHPLSVRKIL